jgi:rubrerythrin
MGSTWLCLDCGWMFLWIRQGIETRPDSCPSCGSENVDVVEA